MSQKSMVYDGEKSVPLNSLVSGGWIQLSGSSDGTFDRRSNRNYEFVGIVNRCVNVRASTLAALPWSIMKDAAAEPIYTSNRGSPPENLPFLRGFKRNLYLIESSLVIWSRSYLYKQQLGPKLYGLQWMMPQSITPRWTQGLGLEGFTRHLSLDKITEEDGNDLPLEKVCFIWYPNPLHETVFATSPLQAAAAEAGVVFSINEFAARFIERGAVKATVLTVEQAASPQARQELETWWKRVASGVKNAWTTKVVSDAVKPVVIGEGFQEVVATEITKQKAFDVATTIGVPHSLVFGGSANYATAGVDIQNFYNYTIFPDADMIEEELNDKVFRPQGLFFRFEKEQIHALNQDNVREATAYKLFVESGMKPSVAAKVAGVTLPTEVSGDQLDKDFESRQQQKEKMKLGAQDKVSAEEQARGGYESKKNPLKDSEAATFKKWLRKKLTVTKEVDLSNFESDILTDEDKVKLRDEVLAKMEGMNEE